MSRLLAGVSSAAVVAPAHDAAEGRAERTAATAAATVGEPGSRLGRALGAARLHTGPQAAAAADRLQARAFTVGNDIAFGAGQYAPSTPAGRRLLAHELAHTIEPAGDQGRPVVRRQPLSNPPYAFDPLGLMGPPIALPAWFGQLDAPPQAEVPVETRTVLGPSLARTKISRERDAELLTFTFPTTIVDELHYFAIPTTHVFPTPEAAAASGLPVPPAPTAQTRTTTPTVPPPGTPPPVAPPPVTPPVTPLVAPAVKLPAIGSTVYTPDGVGHVVLGATPEAVVTRTFTKYAVGAGSTGLLEGGGTFILVDAGTFGRVPSVVRTTTLQALEARIGRGGVIAQVLITHAHADHMNLLPELAERFQIRAIRVNDLQADRADFQTLMNEVRAANNRRIVAETERVRAAVEAGRDAWMKADKGDPLDRAARFDKVREDRVAEARARMADIQLERLVPGVRGRLTITSQPVGSTGPARLQTVPAETLAPGVRAPAVHDPQFSFVDELGKRTVLTAQNIDKLSSAWVIDVKGQTRFIVMPDIRGQDFADILHGFRRATAALGMEARFQVWDVSHHMQIGWSDPKGVEARPGVSVRATQLGNITRFLNTFRAGSVSRPGTDVVVVSAYEGFPKGQTGTTARSYVDPANVFILRSLGFEVFLATSGQDVQVLEVLTSKGRKVTGVVGAERGGERPAKQLLRTTEAALAELRDQARLARNELRRMRTESPDSPRRAEAQSRIDHADRLVRELEQLKHDYLQGIHDELSRSPKKPAGNVADRSPVAPEANLPEPAAAQARALEAKLQAEGLNRLVPTTGSPRFTEAALAIVRPGALNPNAAAGTPAARAYELVQIRERIRGLEQGRATVADAARVRGELLSELHRYRIALEAQVRAPESTGSSRAVLDDMLRSTRERIKALTPGPETTGTKQRIPGTGALVDTKVLSSQRLAPGDKVPVGGEAPPARPSLGERSGKLIEGVTSRGFGALMIYQTITAESDVLARAGAGQASAEEVAATTARSALGVTVGYRMLRGLPVSNGVFVVLSLLEVAEAASKDYASGDQRRTEIAYAALRGGVNFGLMYIGGVLMAAVPPPLGVLAGLGVMLLGDTILDALGAHDWIEQLMSFQPRAVTAVEQQMRSLIAEYEVIVGAIELAERSDTSLRQVGAPDPAALRAAGGKVADQHRLRALPLEEKILGAFADAYERAQGAYAGLAELDEMRRKFYQLMQRAHPNDEEITAFRRVKQAMLDTLGGVVSTPSFGIIKAMLPLDQRRYLEEDPAPVRTQARDAFEAIEKKLSLAEVSQDAVMKMEQWRDIDDKLDQISAYIHHAYFGVEIDFAGFSEADDHARKMLSNARYRIDPPPGSYRTTPLLPSAAPGYNTYIGQLETRERRYWWLNNRLSETLAGRAPKPIKQIYMAGEPWEKREEAPTFAQRHDAGLALDVASRAQRAYDELVAGTTAPPASLVNAMFTNSADALTGYKTYLRQHETYRNRLGPLELQQRAMLQLLGRARTVVDPASTVQLDTPQTEPTRERLRMVMLAVRASISHRYDELGMVFPSETDALAAKVRESEVGILTAALGGTPAGYVPLSPAERRAGREEAIRDVAPRLGSTVDRISQIPELRGLGTGGPLTGVYRLVGIPDGYDLPDALTSQDVSASKNALVGDLGEGESFDRGFRHLRHTVHTRRCLPLNDAAIEVMGGTGTRDLTRYVLKTVTLAELNPGAPIPNVPKVAPP
ncbi:DUF4157 domain-containing protein [Microbacterium sp. B2969]|uniref:DUF4157 domain-containing protein n=1 Tax=Microbacterium alkaliflavum TaxID=3248839 RepID=A0ABW7Q3T9_9MICO